MHVEHLLQDESLGVRLLWAEDALLKREISGVTVTDLEDPARFVRPDEVVLSGLVWWSAGGGKDKAERFVSGLKDAGAVALLAGEETHGAVSDDLVEACLRHGVPVAGVPAHVMFRAITDAVYLRQWGGLSRHHALPEHVRVRLNRLVSQDADPALILATAFTHPDADPAYVLTPPPRLLQEISAVLARCQDGLAHRRATEQRTADELGRLPAAPEARDLAGALRACGLPADGPYPVIVADTGVRREGPSQGALTEAVAHTTPAFSAVGRLPDGSAFAVVPEDAAAALVRIWPLVAACEPDVLPHGGLASPATEATGLPGPWPRPVAP
ncbi:hypothetical protein J2Z21_009448 [Streptomyces griseochromogenes]|uniref:Purine catabolism PurC-like domain-containing protein n=1 Tax=Streptomyces griseochromogenes TaxID=68214 RepID=A0A1B1AYV1_9ACTN|nr:PucR family transcriptional regulator ligand-binding domain-containing protein [Streptomyces griseochromogenes]ANP51727.1 hypothetical protein AVL59_20945 [Streptomyces griseochromogenes]MBP2056430.1 hypothetical protein [Streptomyces griseochromogenes]